MNIENLENEFISFELSEEDLEAIGGGTTANQRPPIFHFPLPWIIRIKAVPIDPSWVIRISPAPPTVESLEVH
jgi:hypothetical protein